MRESKKGDVEDWQLFKSAVVGCTEKVCGMRRMGGGMRKGSEWYREAIRVAVPEKRHAHGVWL